MDKTDRYIPALGRGWLTPLYDPLLRWGMREQKFKRHLVNQARIEAGHRVLDLGCGTATLTILIKQSHPDAIAIGIDGDRRVLDIGRAKAARAGVDITLDYGLAFQLPYDDRSFDRVLSSLVMHHLTTENKRRTATEIFRVLRPGGELHVVDFGKPYNLWTRFMSQIMQRSEQVSDNVKGLLPKLFRQARFEQVTETAHYTTLFGGLSVYRAVKPA